MPKIIGSHHTDPAIRSLICAKAAAGFSTSEIASFVNCSISTVQHSIRHTKERGHHMDAARSGRPPKMDERCIRHLKLTLECDWHQILSNITSTVNTFLPSPVVPRTVQRAILSKLNMSSCIAAKKPFLTQRHRLGCKEWAKEKVAWDMTNWSRVI